MIVSCTASPEIELSAIIRTLAAPVIRGRKGSRWHLERLAGLQHRVKYASSQLGDPDTPDDQTLWANILIRELSRLRDGLLLELGRISENHSK